MSARYKYYGTCEQLATRMLRYFASKGFECYEIIIQSGEKISIQEFFYFRTDNS